jgi:hypothetical protein
MEIGDDGWSLKLCLFSRRGFRGGTLPGTGVKLFVASTPADVLGEEGREEIAEG